MSTPETVKYVLGERDIPTHWVNLMADLPPGERRCRCTRGPRSPPAPTTSRRCSR